MKMGFETLKNENLNICGEQVRIIFPCYTSHARGELYYWICCELYLSEESKGITVTDTWYAQIDYNIAEPIITRLEVDRITGQPQLKPELGGEIYFMRTLEFFLKCE